MFLLDTDIVWQLRGAASADAIVTGWAERQQRTSLFVSVLTLMELGQAAEELARTDKQGGAAMRHWLDGAVATAFDGRVIPVDAKVAGRAARLSPLAPVDALIAATALEHGLTLATRSPAAFKAARIKVLDPGRSDGGEAAAIDDADWRQASRGGPVWLRNLFARG